jgi:putative restriction endonuclease
MLAAMSKYDGLRDLLRRHSLDAVTLSMGAINDAVAGGIPPSAYRHPAWWAKGTGVRHVQAEAWLSAGWSVGDVDLTGRAVTFVGEVDRR